MFCLLTVIKLQKTNKTTEAALKESTGTVERINNTDDTKAEKKPLKVSGKCSQYQNNTILSFIRLKRSTSSKMLRQVIHMVGIGRRHLLEGEMKIERNHTHG